MKQLLAATLLLLACTAWAAAPGDDTAADRIEAAQLRADIAWQKLASARRELDLARQNLTEAEQADEQARLRARAAADAFQDAKDRLAVAQAREKQAAEEHRQATDTLNILWNDPVRPR